MSVKLTLNPASSIQDRYLAITAFFREHPKVLVHFRKKDGELRSMPCTQDPAVMPVEVLPAYHKTTAIDFDVVVVWCIDKAAWRSFRTENLISAESIVD